MAQAILAQERRKPFLGTSSDGVGRPSAELRKSLWARANRRQHRGMASLDRLLQCWIRRWRSTGRTSRSTCAGPQLDQQWDERLPAFRVETRHDIEATVGFGGKASRASPPRQQRHGDGDGDGREVL